MKTMTLTTLLSLACAAMLAACGPSSNKTEPVSFSTLETARAQAIANAEFNAKAYRAANPRFTDHKIMSHGDSTQSPDCPQGDGWATLNVMRVEGKDVEKFTIKCSTVSLSLGCYMEPDFVKKTFANEEGHCQPINKVPFPLPKIGG
jgi:ABC-type uncharacterized transport system auxiliary subunit